MTLPRVRVARREDADEMVAQLRQARRVALDTEFHPERRYLPQLYLIQYYTGEGPAWIVDPFVDGLVAAIAPHLLALPWLVHSGTQDLRILRQALGGVPDVAWDTQVAAGLVANHYPASYGALVEQWLNLRLPKGATLSDWSRRPLDEQQLRYAADDVLHLPALWDALAAKAETLGRSVMLERACIEARESALNPDSIDLWRDIPGHNSLNPRQAAVLRALAAWRDAEARIEDISARNVLADSILLDLARRQPREVADIQSDRRVPRGFGKRYGDELLTRIAEARALGDEDLPLMLDRQGPLARVVDLLHCIIEAEGAAAAWAARLVAPRPMLERAAIEARDDRARIASILGDWRDALVGDTLHAALGGQRTLQIRGADVEILTLSDVKR